ncbi:MAG: MFS transporter, partial [Sphingomicrobium sp.]
IILPVGGLLAHTVSDDAKGRAAGWYQAGNLGGTGLGGAAGLWLATHFSRGTAGSVLALAMIASGLSIFFVPDVRLAVTESIGQRLRLMGRDIKAMVTTALPLFTIALVLSPIGAGAMNGLWSAVSGDWHASADRVALVTGLLGGLVSAIGCIIGGWVADLRGRWWAYFGSGVALAAVAGFMAMAPLTPFTYSVGVLAYSLFCGMAYAAFSAIILFAIGRGVASTKYALLSSLGNIPVIYMTVFNGWVHDRHGVAWMLLSEAIVGLIASIAGFAALRAIAGRIGSRPRRGESHLLTTIIK